MTIAIIVAVVTGACLGVSAGLWIGIAAGWMDDEGEE